MTSCISSAVLQWHKSVAISWVLRVAPICCTTSGHPCLAHTQPAARSQAPQSCVACPCLQALTACKACAQQQLQTLASAPSGMQPGQSLAQAQAQQVQQVQQAQQAPHTFPQAASQPPTIQLPGLPMPFQGAPWGMEWDMHACSLVGLAWGRQAGPRARGGQASGWLQASWGSGTSADARNLDACVCTAMPSLVSRMGPKHGRNTQHGHHWHLKSCVCVCAAVPSLVPHMGPPQYAQLHAEYHRKQQAQQAAIQQQQAQHPHLSLVRAALGAELGWICWAVMAALCW